ncbi:hypothetical protein CgunFtcFv8_019427 [Champsocephalus gunnari]|uniref:Polyhomeotic-like protein 1 n=1 Tax=Champsocephalus gunnari TaxID=52237 RepID=A0AAN8HNT6_CHAGU|nr:hypothetical protein CgunFtcFv8_019427 [Champsocephalus gunnari]
MDAGEDQNTGTTNGNPQTTGNSRAPQIAHMSLYERQAVQALQALQRQPNAAQYFQQLMLQQQINSAQLHNLAAVQQATLAASRQSNTPSNSMSQANTTVNLSTTSTGGNVTNPRPHGPATSATTTTTTTLNQSVLLGGNSGQGQMYLRVNRSLRAPLASQLIFMPGGTATATVATVAQTQPQQQQQQQLQQQQQQQHEVAPAQSDNDQVQNLALHCASTHRGVSVKCELPERKDVAFSQQQQTFAQTVQLQQVQPQHQQHMAKTNFAHQTTAMHLKAGTPAASVAPSSTSSQVLPLSQLLLSSSATPMMLVPTSNVSTTTQGYSIGTVTQKANINTQTLVVQPLQQACTPAEKGPVPIQPKTVQGHRLPVQMSPRHPPHILPAPPHNSHNPPHIPVQLVGARQGLAGNAQAVALAQARCSMAQESTAAGNVNNSTMIKPGIGSLKRKSDCDASNDMATESFNSAPMKHAAPPLSPGPKKDSAPPAAAAFSCPPTLSLPLPLSRVGHGDKDRAVPQAVVKPQVLTHLIEGFVIQEGAEPFPVAGLLKDRDFALVGRSENGPPLLKCEYCGSLAPASQFKGSKRFCSNTCAKRYNVSCSQHFKTSRGRSGGGLPPPPPHLRALRGEGARRAGVALISTVINYQAGIYLLSFTQSPVARRTCPATGKRRKTILFRCPQAPHTPALEPSAALLRLTARLLWSVEEVCRFISSLQGCEELAAHFLSQEIDGQALMLLREDHLISTMNIKLGPALKICASINTLRE